MQPNPKYYTRKVPDVAKWGGSGCEEGLKQTHQNERTDHGKQVGPGAYRRNDGRDNIGLHIPVENTNTVLGALPVCESSHSEVVKVVAGASGGTKSLKPRAIK